MTQPKMLAPEAARVAIVHEWLSSYAGSERVLEELLHGFPEARLHAVCDFLPPAERSFLGGREVATTFIQRLPLARTRFRNYLPLMPLAIEQLDLSAFDIVISSNHAVAKGVITRPDQLHVSYVHTPIRYAWDLQNQYLDQAGLSSLKGWLARLILHYLRQWDQASAHRVDTFVANSRFVARRIWKCYRRKAHVIYPPVDVDRFPLVTKKEDYYLAASRFVPYKRMSLIVKAFSQTPDRKLIVIGDGPEFDKVASKAGSNVEMLGYQAGPVLCDYMQRARAFVFAAEEDFGITPVEAQACGTPVIAFGRGGVLETVVAGKTGLFFAEQTVPSMLAALDQFEATEAAFDPSEIRSRAERFHIQVFRRRFLRLVDRTWDRFQRHLHKPTRAKKP
jgi:O-antigen biosynthesis alpha-1,3-mannosyltransferase